MINMPRVNYKHSEETKEKIRLAHIGKPNGRLGKKMSEETKLKISLANKGKKRTKEQIENIRKAHFGQTAWNKGLKGYRKGIYMGENHPNWKGGISRDKHNSSNPKYKEWRLSIFNRDNYTCCGCNKVGGKLQAHHIKKWSIYPELRFDINNGITLCEDCHKLTDNYGNSKNTVNA